jgi:hypothetical protein
MTALGLGCVKTRRRAAATERTFFDIAIECANQRDFSYRPPLHHDDGPNVPAAGKGTPLE